MKCIRQMPPPWSKITGKPTWIGSSKPTYTKSEVGLSNVDNVKQYSASNPPPDLVCFRVMINSGAGGAVFFIAQLPKEDPRVSGYNGNDMSTKYEDVLNYLSQSNGCAFGYLQESLQSMMIATKISGSPNTRSIVMEFTTGSNVSIKTFTSSQISRIDVASVQITW